MHGCCEEAEGVEDRQLPLDLLLILLKIGRLRFVILKSYKQSMEVTSIVANQ